MDRRATPERDHARVVAPPPLFFAAGYLAGMLLERVVPLPDVPAVARALGVPLIAAGVLLLGWFVVALRRARTPLDPYRPTTALVTSGPYRLSRNPAYLAMATIVAGSGLASNTLWAVVLLPVVLLVVRVGVIAREERYLERRFGSEYRAYKERTRRWV